MIKMYLTIIISHRYVRFLLHFTSRMVFVFLVLEYTITAITHDHAIQEKYKGYKQIVKYIQYAAAPPDVLTLVIYAMILGEFWIKRLDIAKRCMFNTVEGQRDEKQIQSQLTAVSSSLTFQDSSRHCNRPRMKLLYLFSWLAFFMWLCCNWFKSCMGEGVDV